MRMLTTLHLEAGAIGGLAAVVQFAKQAARPLVQQRRQVAAGESGSVLATSTHTLMAAV